MGVVALLCGIVASALILRIGLMKQQFKSPALLLSIIILIGFIVSPGVSDVAGLKQGTLSIAQTGKIYRIATVLLVAMAAFLFAAEKKCLGFIVRGNLVILLVYFLLALLSVVFSELKMMTLYKSFEIFVVLLVGTTVYSHIDRQKEARRFISGLFWFYVLTIGLVWIQFFILGPQGQFQLRYETPFLRFMLGSKYPGMVGNALGFLGALVTLFGLYLMDYPTPTSPKNKLIGLSVFIFSFPIVILSYTRSILVFLIFVIMIYFLINKKFMILFLTIIILTVSLLMPHTREKIVEHMKRGASDEKIYSLSGRINFWNHVLERDTLQLMLGEGFGTGTLFQNYSDSNLRKQKIFTARNAHNSIFEIIMSSGFIGASVWLFLMLRILWQLIFYYIKFRGKIGDDELRFHKFVIAVFILSFMRSMMNSTFVYLDYFLFILVAIAVYCDTLSNRMNEFYKIISPKKSIPIERTATANMNL